MLKKITQKLLQLNHFRKFIGQEMVFNAVKSKFKLEALDCPPSGRVLVVAPHPDDDVIGCGGAIAAHIKSDNEVKVIYVTDGSMGFAGLKRPTVTEKSELSKLRELEARDAAKILGVTDLVFWRYRDGNLNANETSVKLMQSLLATFKPEIIYVPSFLDSNSDHAEVCQIFAKGLKRTTVDPEIMSYEVWNPVLANRLVKIDKYIELKKSALGAHKTQLKSRGYLNAVIGLNQYRAGMFNAGLYAEAFFASNKELYYKLLNLTELKK